MSYPHLGLIKIEYSIHKYLPSGEIDPAIVDHSNGVIITTITGEDQNICIRKVKELIDDIKRSK